jgi:hypothetical protein
MTVLLKPVFPNHISFNISLSYRPDNSTLAAVTDLPSHGTSVSVGPNLQAEINSP